MELELVLPHVLARLCKDAGALTIAIVTYPFSSEGSLRKQNADWGLERLTEVCDTVIVLPNERLLSVEGVRDLPLNAAFRVVMSCSCRVLEEFRT